MVCLLHWLSCWDKPAPGSLPHPPFPQRVPLVLGQGIQGLLAHLGLMESSVAANWRSGNRTKGFPVTPLPQLYLSISITHLLITTKNVLFQFLFITTQERGHVLASIYFHTFSHYLLGSFTTCL